MIIFPRAAWIGTIQAVEQGNMIKMIIGMASRGLEIVPSIAFDCLHFLIHWMITFHTQGHHEDDY
jgi:hypothetical protein